jgi:methyl-accepting chemotaxis protein
MEKAHIKTLVENQKARVEEQKKKISVRWLITLPTLAYVGSAILILAAVSVFLNYRSTIDTLEQSLTAAAGIAQEAVGYKLGGIEEQLIGICANETLYDEESLKSARLAYLSDKVKEIGALDAFFLSLDGTELRSGTSYADKDYFLAAKNGEAFVSIPFTDEKSGQLAMVFSAPIWQNGRAGSTVVGVACFTMPQSVLNDIAGSFAISENGSAYVLDKNGLTIAHIDLKRVASDNIGQLAQSNTSLSALAALHNKAVAGETGFGQYSFQGVRKLLAYTPIVGTDGWAVCINAPTSDFTGSLTRSIIITIVLAILFIIGTAIGGFYIAWRVTEPLKVFVKRLSTLAEGDVLSAFNYEATSHEFVVLKQSLDRTLDNTGAIITDIDYLLGEFSMGNFDVHSQAREHYVGDYENILSSLRKLKFGLSDAFRGIALVSDQVSAGASQVSLGAQTLAQGATEQASSIQELSASVADVSQRIKSNAEDADRAKALTMESETVMRSSVGDMQLARSAMDEISATSKNIGKVIKTIDDIAFQTNILALNAAVEAARAGAAGKGFAVVADEVRNLSQKSAEAAKNTAALIESAIEAVEKGAQLVTRTSEDFVGVAAKAKDVAGIVDTIAVQAEEQANAIAQISIGIDQISSVVQMNSATSEESAAASEELSSQAETLHSLVGKFTLAGE